jgi:hypothetical protein
LLCAKVLIRTSRSFGSTMWSGFADAGNHVVAYTRGAVIAPYC